MSQVWNDARGECESPSGAATETNPPHAAPPVPPTEPTAPLAPLRAHRLELEAGWAYTLNPSTISPNSIGLGLDYYVADGLGVGLLGQYGIAGSAPNPNASRWPLEEVGWSTEANVAWVPISAGGEQSSLRFELVLTGGVGAIATRPVPEYDPARSFGYKVGVDGVAGAALRLFLTRSLSVSLALRDRIYSEQTEAQSIATISTHVETNDYGPSRLVQQIDVGLSASYWL